MSVLTQSKNGKLKRSEVQPTKLNLGCGKRKVDGFTGIDISPDCGADIVHDLTVVPWPIESDSIEEATSSHFFEHIPGLIRPVLMDELWRVLKMDATATFVTPYGGSERAFQDYTHAWPPIFPASYLYFNRKWREDNELDHYNVKCNFDFTYGYNINNPWANRSQEAKDFGLRHYFNVAEDLHVILTKRA